MRARRHSVATVTTLAALLPPSRHAASPLRLLNPSHHPHPSPRPAAACLEEQHLTDSHVRAAFDFFDHNQSGQITESDVVQVGVGGWAARVENAGVALHRLPLPAWGCPTSAACCAPQRLHPGYPPPPGSGRTRMQSTPRQLCLPCPCWMAPCDAASLACAPALPPQVLRDVGMDESDAEQLMAAASVSRAPSAAAGSEAAAAARGGGTAPGSGATSRCISYEDFRRMLLNQPAAVITQVGGSGSGRRWWQRHCRQWRWQWHCRQWRWQSSLRGGMACGMAVPGGNAMFETRRAAHASHAWHTHPAGSPCIPLPPHLLQALSRAGSRGPSRPSSAPVSRTSSGPLEPATSLPPAVAASPLLVAALESAAKRSPAAGAAAAAAAGAASPQQPFSASLPPPSPSQGGPARRLRLVPSGEEGPGEGEGGGVLVQLVQRDCCRPAGAVPAVRMPRAHAPAACPSRRPVAAVSSASGLGSSRQADTSSSVAPSHVPPSRAALMCRPRVPPSCALASKRL